MTTPLPPPTLRPGAPTAKPGVAAPHDVPYLLINPPLTDPTTAYHSISYLVGATEAAGFTRYQCLDANVRALNFMARPRRVADVLARANLQRITIEASPTPTRAEQLQYRVALKAAGLRATDVSDAIGRLQDPSTFYDYSSYRRATLVLRRWVDLLGLGLPPGLLDGFGVRARGPVDLTSIAAVTDPTFLDAVDAVFGPYWDSAFRGILHREAWALAGLSVSYLSQLPFALALARRIRRERPDTFLVMGGTEVSDDVKYLTDRSKLWQLFADADAIVVGEGEHALVDLLEAARRRQPLPPGTPGVLLRQTHDTRCEVRYEDVASLPRPQYRIWEWSAYWSPEPIILYSPTRGCYWNRCTFCDYGLNSDRPTSPSRERPPELVARDLAALRSWARAVYFAVDAMSPVYIRKLCTALSEVCSDMRWAAELRLERAFPRFETGRLLKEAGCVAISFGYESGTQRILDLIDKGIRIVDVPQVLSELKSHGIGAQMMGFTGFPTETTEEAEETYQFLLRHYDDWSLAGIGEFVLTAGAVIARAPEKFGITLMPPSETSDIHRVIRWQSVTHTSRQASVPDSSDEAVTTRALQDRLLKVHDDRPFVGGIDSSHSLLYFARYGPRLIPDDDREAPSDGRWSFLTPFAGLDDFATVANLERHRSSTADARNWLAGRYDGSWDPERPVTADIYPSGDIGPTTGSDETDRGSDGYSELERFLLAGYGAM